MVDHANSYIHTWVEVDSTAFPLELTPLRIFLGLPRVPDPVTRLTLQSGKSPARHMQ